MSEREEYSLLSSKIAAELAQAAREPDHCAMCGVDIGPGSASERGMLCRDLCIECEDDVPLENRV